PTNICTLVRVHAVMIGDCPKGVKTGRLAPLWTVGEGAAGAEPFGLVRIGPARAQIFVGQDTRPRPSGTPTTAARFSRAWRSPRNAAAANAASMAPARSPARRPAGYSASLPRPRLH